MGKHYQPKQKEEYMNDAQLQYFKEKLLSMKKEYGNISLARFNALTNSGKDTDVIDVSLTDADILNENNHAYMQKEIDDALERIEDGSYGYCEDTDKKIGIKRLIANPVARYSITAQEKYDMQREILYKSKHDN